MDGIETRYRLHQPARTVYIGAGLFFLSFAVLFGPLGIIRGLDEPDNQLLLCFGLMAFVAAGWCIAYARFGQLIVGAKELSILTGLGWRHYRYKEVAALATFHAWTAGAGIQGVLLRRRLGERTVNLYLKLRSGAVHVYTVSTFERCADMLRQIELCSRKPIEAVTTDSFDAWRRR